MGLTKLIAGIEAALLDRRPLDTIRVLLFALRDQAEALEASLPSSYPQHGGDEALRQENARLKLLLADAHAQIENLQAEAHAHRLPERPEAQDRILKCIACLGPHSTADLQETLFLGEESIRFHLHQLHETSFLGINADAEWTLMHGGRHYLDQRGLLN